MTDSRVITRAVRCNWRRGYAFAADPLRLPDWASGLAKSTLTRVDDTHWTLETVQGPARLRFAPPNDFGVLDHWVAPEGVAEIYLPFRVIALDADLCQFQFTLLRQPHMDDAAFDADAAAIARDLQALQGLLEG